MKLSCATNKCGPLSRAHGGRNARRTPRGKIDNEKSVFEWAEPDAALVFYNCMETARGHTPLQLSGYGDVSTLDWFLASIGFPEGLASDVVNNVSSAPDPASGAASAQSTLNAALTNGTITGDQYNQAMAQITAQAQANASTGFGPSVAAAGNAILSGSEGVALLVGVGLLVWGWSKFS